MLVLFFLFDLSPAMADESRRPAERVYEVAYGEHDSSDHRHWQPSLRFDLSARLYEFLFKVEPKPISFITMGGNRDG